MKAAWLRPRSELTREARDSLFLIGVVLLTVAPHLLRLPLWASSVVIGLLAWRGWLALKSRSLPPRWLLVGLLVAVVVATRLSFGVLIGRESGMTLVCVLLSMKLLEMHARRDAFVVFFLGFFLVLLQYLHSQALWVALWTLAAVWGLMSSLVLAQMPLGQPSLRVAGREAARATLLGLPLMVFLFLLFPRMAPLWGVPGSAASSGLSDELRFGDVAQMALDESPAMRLRALPGSSLPPSSQMYVRGPVLNLFDGERWRADPNPDIAPEPLQLSGPLLRYEVILEAQRVPLLPLLEVSPGQPGEIWPLQEGLSLRRNGELSWLARRSITERLRFEHAVLADPNEARMGPISPHHSLAVALQWPQGLNPRLRAWAREQAARLPPGPARAPAMVQQVLLHIRQQPYIYSLAPGLYGENTPHAVDEFWFDRRNGFCEHYASAFVLALRAAEVPARLVTGFQGADVAPTEGWTVIRNSHAHAWAEFWMEGRGWQRVDPTAAVAPERVRTGQLLPQPAGVLRGAVNAIDPTLWLRLRQLGEGMDLRWQQWVLGYQRQQQFGLLEALGFKSPNWETLGQVVAGCIALVAGAGLLWQRLSRPRGSRWTLRLARVHARLRRLGLPAKAHQAPLRWALLASERPALAEALLELEALRYGPASSSHQGWQARWQAWQAWLRWWRQFSALAR